MAASVELIVTLTRLIGEIPSEIVAVHVHNVSISMRMIRLPVETFGEAAFRAKLGAFRQGVREVAGRWSGGGTHLPLGGGEVRGEVGTGRFQQTVDPFQHGVGLLPGQRVHVEVFILLWGCRSWGILCT